MWVTKHIALICGLSFILTGCVSNPVLLPAVGPNPYLSASPTAYGELEVYSALEQHEEGDNPTWEQHSLYFICDSQGKRFKTVYNVIGYYEKPPKRVKLPTGSYLVKARAYDYLSVQVPITIEGGLLTTVYLDGTWSPPAGTSKDDLAFTPKGHPIGWRTKETLESQQPKN
jgi:hypothetical protein